MVPGQTIMKPRTSSATYLVEDLHQQDALVVSPNVAFQLSVPDTPSDFIRLEVPSTTNEANRLLLFFDDVATTGLVEVLDSERRRLVNRTVDENVTVAVTDGYTRVVGRERDACAEDCLSAEVFGKAESPRCTAVDACERSLDDRTRD